MTDHIPFAIQAEIMKHLPAKSLMQFRSVSKTWKALIESSKFVTDYNIQQTKQYHLLVHYRHFRDGKPQFVMVVDDDTFPRHKVSLPSPIQRQDRWVQPIILGVSQGVICLSPYNHAFPPKRSSIVLWNPCIRKSVTVDVTNKMTGHGFQSVIGFGVRPDTSDPTLVKVNYSYSMPFQDTTTHPWEVEVYTLSSGVWRSIPTINQPSDTMIMAQQVTIDDFIYFRAVDKISIRGRFNLIMSFDMISEEMTRVSLPIALAPDCNLGISKLNGSLVVLETVNEVTKQVFVIWMMERGVSNSFTKLFTVNPPDALISSLLGFRKNNEPILSSYYEEVNDIFVHEHNNNKFVCINGEAFPYMETLLLLDH